MTTFYPIKVTTSAQKSARNNALPYPADTRYTRAAVSWKLSSRMLVQLIIMILIGQQKLT